MEAGNVTGGAASRPSEGALAPHALFQIPAVTHSQGDIDVVQVNRDGPGADTESLGDFASAHVQGHESGHLPPPWGESVPPLGEARFFRRLRDPLFLRIPFFPRVF